MRWIFFLLTFALAQPANALVCVPLDDALAHLAERWHETPVFTGAFEDGAWIVTAAPDGGSFTILRLTPDGMTCIAGAGEGWAAAPVTHSGKDG
jgi:hypothetical protein